MDACVHVNVCVHEKMRLGIILSTVLLLCSLHFKGLYVDMDSTQLYYIKVTSFTVVLLS